MSGLGITSIVDTVRTRASGFLGLRDFHVELKRSIQGKEIACSLHWQLTFDEEEIIRCRDGAAREILASVEKGIREGSLMKAAHTELRQRVLELEHELEHATRDLEAQLAAKTDALRAAEEKLEELERFKTYYQLSYELRHGKKETA